MERSMLAADDHGVRLRVWVVAGASRSGLDGRHGGALRIRVSSPAERGRANRELVELVSEHFGCLVTVVAGHRARSKTLLLHDMTVPAARSMLPS